MEQFQQIHKTKWRHPRRDIAFRGISCFIKKHFRDFLLASLENAALHSWDLLVEHKLSLKSFCGSSLFRSKELAPNAKGDLNENGGIASLQEDVSFRCHNDFTVIMIVYVVYYISINYMYENSRNRKYETRVI